METTARLDFENDVMAGYKACLEAYEDFGDKICINPFPWKSGRYLGWAKGQVTISEREDFASIQWNRSV